MVGRWWPDGGVGLGCSGTAEFVHLRPWDSAGVNPPFMVSACLVSDAGCLQLHVDVLSS